MCWYGYRQVSTHSHLKPSLRAQATGRKTTKASFEVPTESIICLPGPQVPFLTLTCLSSLGSISTSRWGQTSLAQGFEKSLNHKMLCSAAFLLLIVGSPVSASLSWRLTFFLYSCLSGWREPRPICLQPAPSSTQTDRVFCERQTQMQRELRNARAGWSGMPSREALAQPPLHRGAKKVQGGPEPCCMAHC